VEVGDLEMEAVDDEISIRELDALQRLLTAAVGPEEKPRSTRRRTDCPKGGMRSIH
jgi:hypothetical protein